MDDRGVDVMPGRLIWQPTLISIGLRSDASQTDQLQRDGAVGPPKVDEVTGLSLRGYEVHNWEIALIIKLGYAFAGMESASDTFDLVRSSSYAITKISNSKGTSATLEPLNGGDLYTSSNGMKIHYDYLDNGSGEEPGSYYRATKIVYPSGVVIRQNWKNQFLCGDGSPTCAPEYQISIIRLMSVTYSLGYQINFDANYEVYQEANTSLDYCNPETGECPSGINILNAKRTDNYNRSEGTQNITIF